MVLLNFNLIHWPFLDPESYFGSATWMFALKSKSCPSFVVFVTVRASYIIVDFPQMTSCHLNCSGPAYKASYNLQVPLLVCTNGKLGWNKVHDITACDSEVLLENCRDNFI